jgi:hypothetical protein
MKSEPTPAVPSVTTSVNHVPQRSSDPPTNRETEARCEMAIMRATQPSAPSVVIVYREEDAVGATLQGVEIAGAPSEAEGRVPAAASAQAGVRPDGVVVVIGVSSVVIGLLVSWGINLAIEPTAFRPAAGISVFALLYIAAQGLERLMEPFASWVGSTEVEVVARDQAVARALTTSTELDVAAAATAQAELNKKRANRGIALWAVATLLAMLGSAIMGLYLLQIVGATNVPRVLEIAVTGLAIGGGTKPLHDLIASVETKKEQAQDPAEMTGV